MQIVPASESVRQGQEIYRFKRAVKTTGFGVEFDVSTKAIVVGPESDFAEYRVVYFDPTRQLLATLATITPSRPFIGRLDSRMDIQPSGLTTKTATGKPIPQTGRLVVVPENDFDITAFTNLGGEGVIKDPIADLIGYTSDVALVPEGRSNFRLDTAIKIGLGEEITHYIPSYGRRAISFANRIPGGSPIEVSLLGFSFTNRNETAGVGTVIDGIANQAGFVTAHYESTSKGGYDYIGVRISGIAANDPENFDDGGYRIVVTMSDEQGGV